MTDEIARSEWPQALERLGQRYRGGPVTIESRATPLTVTLVADDRPLDAICADPETGAVRVRAADEQGSPISHDVRAVRLRVEQNEEGDLATLFIDELEGGLTTVRFRRPPRVDVVEALAS